MHSATGISNERAWASSLSRLTPVQLVNERRRLERLWEYHIANEANAISANIARECERLIRIINQANRANRRAAA